MAWQIVFCPLIEHLQEYLCQTSTALLTTATTRTRTTRPLRQPAPAGRA